MDQITTNIFLGNTNDAMYRLDVLKDEKVTAVLNVAKDFSNTQITHKDFRMVQVGLGDGSGNSTGALYASVLALGGLLQEKYKVLVHCHEGRSRSPSVVATYLVVVGAFPTIELALAFLKTRRALVAPEKGLLEDFKSLDLDTLRAIIK